MNLDSQCEIDRTLAVRSVKNLGISLNDPTTLTDPKAGENPRVGIEDILRACLRAVATKEEPTPSSKLMGCLS